MGFFREAYHKLVLAPGVSFLFRNAHSGCATVFMLHRFEDKELGIEGLQPKQLRRSLDYLRRNGYEFLSLTELFRRLAGESPPLRNAVVFTIDDGYSDHARIAAPIFAEYDCPVTTFLTTGFLDGDLWLWWDKIAYIATKTSRSSLGIQLGEEVIKYDVSSKTYRSAMVPDFVKRCKVLENSEKFAAIKQLADTADVELPVKPPELYAPMSWNDARACEAKGMTFGPHTVTHPILSRIPEEQAVWEITESWRRLSEEVHAPVPVFCYPNGQFSDFGQREIEIFKRVGLSGAVVGEPGYASMTEFHQENKGPFRVCRFSYPERLPDLVQYVSGIERFKQKVRRSK